MSTIGLFLVLLGIGFGAALWQLQGKSSYVPIKRTSSFLPLARLIDKFRCKEGSACAIQTEKNHLNLRTSGG